LVSQAVDHDLMNVEIAASATLSAGLLLTNDTDQ